MIRIASPADARLEVARYRARQRALAGGFGFGFRRGGGRGAGSGPAPKTFFFMDALASGSSHGTLQDGGSVGSPTSGYGFTPGIQSTTKYAAYKHAHTQSTFGTTPLPSATPGTDDCFRSASQLTGTFTAGDWAVALPSYDNTGNTTTGRLRFRLFRSVNDTGSAATEITNGAVEIAPPFVSGATIRYGTATVALGAVVLTGEYLFFKLAIRIDTSDAGFSGPYLGTSDINNSKIVTPTFFP